MKTKTLPPLRVTPGLRREAEAVLADGETLSAFILDSVARNVEALAFFHDHGFATLGHLDVFLELSKPTPREWKDGVRVHGRRYRY